MIGSYQKIKNLIKILPAKDYTLACKFLEKGDYDSLISLVRSDYIKARKKIDSEEVTDIDVYISDLITLEYLLEPYVDTKDDYYEQ